jgi:enamine deaminase RidA (YjgF/YER057c/UK114 family)
MSLSASVLTGFGGYVPLKARMKTVFSSAAVYATFFHDAPPTRSTIEVSGLPRGAQVEIEAIAIQPS